MALLTPDKTHNLEIEPGCLIWNYEAAGDKNKKIFLMEREREDWTETTRTLYAFDPEDESLTPYAALPLPGISLRTGAMRMSCGNFTSGQWMFVYADPATSGESQMRITIYRETAGAFTEIFNDDLFGQTSKVANRDLSAWIPDTHKLIFYDPSLSRLIQIAGDQFGEDPSTWYDKMYVSDLGRIQAMDIDDYVNLGGVPAVRFLVLATESGAVTWFDTVNPATGEPWQTSGTKYFRRHKRFYIQPGPIQDMAIRRAVGGDGAEVWVARGKSLQKYTLDALAVGASYNPPKWMRIVPDGHNYRPAVGEELIVRAFLYDMWDARTYRTGDEVQFTIRDNLGRFKDEDGAFTLSQATASAVAGVATARYKSMTAGTDGVLAQVL